MPCYCEKYSRMKHRGVICGDCDTECCIPAAKECWNPFLLSIPEREMKKFWIDPIIGMISAVKSDIAMFMLLLASVLTVKPARLAVRRFNHLARMLTAYICSDPGEPLYVGWMRWQEILRQRGVR